MIKTGLPEGWGPIADQEMKQRIFDHFRRSEESDRNTYPKRIPMMDRESRNLLNEIFGTSVPTDEVFVTDELSRMASDRVFDREQVKLIPSDIFMDGTVPINDMLIRHPGWTVTHSGGKVSTPIYRVVFRQEDVERVRDGKCDGDETQGEIIGAVFIYVDERLCDGYCVTVHAIKRGRELRFGARAFGVGSYIEDDYFNRSIVEQNVYDMAYTILVDWYAIQVCLLHPITIDRVRKIQNNAVANRERKKYKRIGSSKLKNIRVCELKAADIIPRPETTGTFTRHCMAWYVQGHMRRTKNGMSWIRPHWRGAERMLHRQSDVRERVIVQAEA